MFYRSKDDPEIERPVARSAHRWLEAVGKRG
jgi:hypothetical protein